jgi:hypothetical protein
VADETGNGTIWWIVAAWRLRFSIETEIDKDRVSEIGHLTQAGNVQRFERMEKKNVDHAVVGANAQKSSLAPSVVLAWPHLPASNPLWTAHKPIPPMNPEDA